jgi:hypothetical protein
MKKIIILLNLCAGSLLFYSAAFASKDPSKTPPEQDRTQIYHISEVGHGTVYPLGGDTAGTCWGISEEGGRWYIDVFDANGNMESWWLNALPIREPDEPDGGRPWIAETGGTHHPITP